MGATVTLSTTTLTYGINPGDDSLVLGSVTGISRDSRLWIDRELLAVISVDSSSNRVKAKRGSDGTTAARHSSSALVTIGSPTQFYSSDPLGAPEAAIPVSPYINVLNGKVWLAQGDASDLSYRWWQEVTSSYGIGPLGIRTSSSDPTSST